MATPSTNIRNKVATILNTINAEEREELLNQLWLPLVIQDVQSHLKDRIDATNPNDWLLLDYHKPGSFETLGHFSTKHPTTFVIAT